MDSLTDILCDQKFVLGEVVDALGREGIISLTLDKDAPGCDVVALTVPLSKYCVSTVCDTPGVCSNDPEEIIQGLNRIVRRLADLVAEGMIRDSINGPLILVGSSFTWSWIGFQPCSTEVRLGLNITYTTNVFAT